MYGLASSTNSMFILKIRTKTEKGVHELKKKLIIFILAILFISLTVGIAYAIDMNRMKNNKPVVFSSWGYDYAPKEAKWQPAVDKVLEQLAEKTRKTITNIDNPIVEECIFDKQLSMYFFNKEVELIGESVYKITFNTTQNMILGPIVFYVNKENNDVIGIRMRN